MSRALLVAALTALTSPALAADPHAGHDMSTMGAPAAADPHAGHVMPSDPAAPDPHAGHDMSAMAQPAAEDGRTGADLPVGNAPPPPSPQNHAADAVYGEAAMARPRDVLAREHGRVRFAMTMLDRLEWRPSNGAGGYAWQGGFRYGGDINRFALKTEGEGRAGVERAEVQALYSRAIGPYFDLQAGIRQDIRPRPQRTYATVGVQGLAPYWFEVGATAFLSDKGDLSARLEAEYDLRLTQRLILQPAAELELAATGDPAIGQGAGLMSGELGLRLRYEFRREFAPYVGVHYERRLGKTADLARAAGEDVGGTRVIIGLRTWF
jgi:copper resistance protein B